MPNDNCFYKVRQKSTGLYYRNSSNSKRGWWGSNGKVYDSLDAVKSQWFGKLINDVSDIEIVLYLRIEDSVKNIKEIFE